MMEKLIEIISNTDDVLMEIASHNIIMVYVIVVILVFLETGLIAFPFLPGDGLLFSAGVVAASTDMNIILFFVLICIGAISGNMVNYHLGCYLGMNFRNSQNRYIKKLFINHFPKAENFYSKYGGAAIIVGRFFPVIRTYIPFLAGVVKMPWVYFLKHTVLGALLWISLFLLSGYFIGEIPWVQQNYGLIFLLLILTTLIPFIYKAIENTLKGRF